MISTTNFQFPNQTGVYHGKVRDVYYIGEEWVVMIATDRISAFDHILPRPIPYKGEVLTRIAAHYLNATRDIVPNWLAGTPAPGTSVGIRCATIPLEMVVRGYLAGHAWRTYQAGGRVLCGVTLPEGLKENDKLPHPIITPSTKAYEGHDEDISRAEILERAIVSEEVLNTLEQYTLALFERGTAMAAERGLILVDTKYEFGIDNTGTIRLIDEVHTPDSSRYFYAEGYQERQQAQQPQQQLSKEFVREWLMENGFAGKEGQTMPVMPDEFVNTVSDRYIALYEKLTGDSFSKNQTEDILLGIQQKTEQFLSQL